VSGEARIRWLAAALAAPALAALASAFAAALALAGPARADALRTPLAKKHIEKQKMQNQTPNPEFVGWPMLKQ
jgi:hypothetical protein